MTTKHLSEIDIQQYAIDKMSSSNQLVDHIQSCKTCRVKADNYKLIFTEIKVQTKPVFNFNLTYCVMNQMQQPKQITSFENIVLYITVCVTILIAGLATYFFRSFISNILTGITPMAVYLVITTLVSLLIFLGIEMVSKYNRQMKILNFN